MISFIHLLFFHFFFPFPFFLNSGISIKLQEEERERRDNYVPERSAIDLDNIEVDADTSAMLREMNFGALPNVTVSTHTLSSGGGGYQRRSNRA